MNSPLLEKISQPSDLKKLSGQQVVQLCADIREFLLENVSKTGGHLASNLGAVELTVALHRVFTTPQDEIVFDVGHQCYTHKLLTGRREGLQTAPAGRSVRLPEPERERARRLYFRPRQHGTVRCHRHRVGQKAARGAGAGHRRHRRRCLYRRHGL